MHGCRRRRMFIAPGFMPSAWITVSRSLSPRPERLTSRMLSGGRAARGGWLRPRRAPIRAPAGCPRVRARRWKAASASRSSAEVYSARPGVAQVGVLRADRGIIQPGGDRMRGGDLAVRVLQHVGVGAVQHARAGPGAGRRSGRRGGRWRCPRRPPPPRSGARRRPRGRRGTGRWRSSRRPRRRCRRPAAARPASRICARASRPITDWKSRTMVG